jgi:hypothetical protein
MIVVLSLLVCVIVWCIKEPISEEGPNVPNDPTPGGEHLSEDEGKSHWLSWSYLILWMIAYNRASVGDYCVNICICHCEPYRCLDYILCLCIPRYESTFLDYYSLFIWMHGWDIWLWINSDVEIWWSRVSATAGVGLCSRAIMVIDLSRRVLLRINDHGCVDISPNLWSCSHLTLYGQGIG